MLRVRVGRVQPSVQSSTFLSMEMRPVGQPEPPSESRSSSADIYYLPVRGPEPCSARNLLAAEAAVDHGIRRSLYSVHQRAPSSNVRTGVQASRQGASHEKPVAGRGARSKVPAVRLFADVKASRRWRCLRLNWLLAQLATDSASWSCNFDRSFDGRGTGRQPEYRVFWQAADAPEWVEPRPRIGPQISIPRHGHE